MQYKFLIVPILPPLLHIMFYYINKTKSIHIFFRKTICISIGLIGLVTSVRLAWLLFCHTPSIEEPAVQMAQGVCIGFVLIFYAFLVAISPSAINAFIRWLMDKEEEDDDSAIC